MAAETAPEQEVAVEGREEDLSDEAITRELCAVCGSSYERLVQTGRDEKVTQIEIFFFGFPRISGLQYFPNLTTLRIVNQPIKSLSGLESCDNLTELWVCETPLQTMHGVQSCVGLAQLYLYSNRIERIEGVETLVQLETLWLSGNCIVCVEGLKGLSELRDLNLAANAISSIEEIGKLQKLESLDLSGNQISYFEDLSPLSSLPHLHTLSLAHPHHAPNPVSLLCNYSSLLIFSFPHLHSLDGQDITSPDIKKLVQGMVSKKKMFYRMKIKHAREVMERKCHTHQQEVKCLKEASYTRLKALQSALKALKRSEDGSEAEEKCEMIRNRIGEICSYLSHVDHSSSQHTLSLRAALERQMREWEIELGSGGNVKYTSGGQRHNWCTSCVELVKSRFSAVSVQRYGFTGMEVKQVLRIENRKLQNRFTSAVQTTIERQCPDSMPPQTKLSDLIEYLFLVWNQETDIMTVSRNGFSDKVAVHLTNSIALADLPRLQHYRGCGQSREWGQRSHETELLLCKMFKGNFVEIKSAEIPPSSHHPSLQSVYRQTTPHSCEWFSFHSSLVVPMFLITIKYLSEEHSESVMDHMTSRDPQTPSDDVILDQAPPLPVQPKLALLDEASLLGITNSPSLSDIQKLCLHGHHLTRFRLSSCPPPLTHSLLPSLAHLSLSSNDLHTAEDLQNLPLLVELDLSFNRITSLEGMKNLPKLRQLDISWNSLTCYFTDIHVLRKHTPSLVSLDCRHNPWTMPEVFRRHTLSRLKTLQTLNSSPVTPDDTSTALQYFTTSQLSPSSLSSHVHTVTHPTPSLSLSTTAHTLHKQHRPQQFTDSINNWGPKVTSVHMVGCNLRRLACFDQLPSLQWLCLDNNCINNIEALSLCPKLEEISLDGNLVTDISPVCSLKHLQMLSADHNVIATLPDARRLKTLTRLHYLSLCHNSIADISGLQNLKSLHELYISSNSIQDRRQIFHLKPLGNFAILSLEHNPLEEEVDVVMGGANYRMFATYHLQSLRALDGAPLDPSEISSAREKLEGRLTQDVIYEQCPGLDLSDTQTLDLPNCSLKSVDLSPVSLLCNLASLNLEYNHLTSFSGLVHLNQLKVLCLNHNRVETLLSRDTSCTETTVLQSLEVLHLAYNGISNMTSLQLSRIPSLRALFLQGNEISRVDGLNGLRNLTELVLDRNRIKMFHEGSFSDLQLRVLLVEENRLRSLSHLMALTNLERLFLGNNKLQDYSEIDKLQPLSQLLELSLISNPISRRHQHRTITIFTLPSLLSLDGVRVTSQERQNAEAIFSNSDEEMVEMLLPVLPNRPAHLRVMNVPFAPSHSSHTHHRHPGRSNHGNNKH